MSLPLVPITGLYNIPPGTWVGPVDDPVRYQLLSVVGAGAEGTTYKARVRLERDADDLLVAVKQFRRPAEAGPDWPLDGAWDDLRRQFGVLAGVQGQHLVDTREVFLGSLAVATDQGVSIESGGPHTPFTVMRWIEGIPADQVASTPEVSLQQRLLWVQQLCTAVRALHSTTSQPGHAMVHGDIKPANCLISPAGDLFLVDLGASERAGGAVAHRGLHTPAYAAPEVLADPYSPRTSATDRYALAATAVQLITGVAPPRASETSAVEAASLVATSPALRRVARRRRRRLADLLTAGLGTDPGAREARDAVEWAQGLQRLGRRPRWLPRTSLALAAALTTAAVLLHAYHLPPFPRAVDAATMSIHWDRLRDSDPSEGSQPGYAVDFAAEHDGWVPSSDDVATAQKADGFDVALRTPAGARLTSPVTPASGPTLLSATATLETGQGAWGLWCRGTATGARYRFLLTHAGAVRISATDLNGAVNTPYGTDFWFLKGIDLSGPVTVQARCEDTDQGVVLTMYVQGRQVLTWTAYDVVLGPGAAGVELYGFDNLEGGALADVSFQRYEQSGRASTA